MTDWWLDLIGYAWVLIAAGFILGAGVAIWAAMGDEYSCAPVESQDDDEDEDDDGEEFPDDPDRARDWGIADEMGAL